MLEVVPNKKTNKRDITQAFACISEDNVSGSFRMYYAVRCIILLDVLFCLALTKQRYPVPYLLLKKLTLTHASARKLKTCCLTEIRFRAKRQGNLFNHCRVINDWLRMARYGGQAVAEDG